MDDQVQAEVLSVTPEEKRVNVLLKYKGYELNHTFFMQNEEAGTNEAGETIYRTVDINNQEEVNKRLEVEKDKFKEDIERAIANGNS
jgi:hypothetical protein